MTKDEALDLALQALEYEAQKSNDNAYQFEREAIKAALANEALERKAENARELGLDYEPEQHQDWCASLTQMMMSMPPKPAPCSCKPLQQEAKDEPDAYGYAKRLAEAIWSKHYKTIAPDWVPLDKLIGVLTQIDNMTAGLISPPQQEAKGEPVAWAMLHDNGHFIDAIHPNEHARVEGEYITPLYTNPPQRTWVNLTNEQFLDACQMAEGGNYMVAFQRIQQWLKEKNT